MADYRGYGKAKTPLLPMIGVPTTAGTGSEAQSYAVIADAETHMKMACGDPSAAFRVALLDPSLTLSAPRERDGDRRLRRDRRTPSKPPSRRSARRSRTASRTRPGGCSSGAYERVLAQPNDFEARSSMQVGAFLAGMAIEQSMLGAAHACANPLTARYDIAHGVALAILLPHVVRWNADFASDRYALLLAGSDGISARIAGRCAREQARGARKDRWTDNQAVRRRSRGGVAPCIGIPRRVAVDRQLQSPAIRCGGSIGDLSSGILMTA